MNARLPGWLIGPLRALATAAGVLLIWRAILLAPADRLVIDLYPSWIAAHLWERGEYAAIYHAAPNIAGREHPAWAALMDEAGLPRQDGTAFTYSPLYLWLFGPLLRMVDLHAASLGMVALNALALAVVAGESARLAGLRAGWRASSIALALALSFPVVAGMWLGQNTLPCLALALLGWRGLERGGRVGTGAGLGAWWLAALMKPWFILIFGVLALMGRWRQLGLGLVGAALLLVGVPALLAPPALLAGYAQMTRGLPDVLFLAWNNVSLRAHLSRLARPDWGRYIRDWTPFEVTPAVRALEAGLLLAAAAAILLWLRARPAERHRLALLLFAALLPLGVVWTHYLVFAIPLVVVTALDPALPRAARAVGLAGALYLLGAAPHLSPTLLHRRESTLALAELAVAAPSLTAWLVELPLLVPLLVAVALAFGAARPLRPG